MHKRREIFFIVSVLVYGYGLVGRFRHGWHGGHAQTVIQNNKLRNQFITHLHGISVILCHHVGQLTLLEVDGLLEFGR